MPPEDCIILAVTPDEVKARNFDSADELMSTLTADNNTVKTHEGKLFLDFKTPGETEGLSVEDSEVAAWFETFDKRHPYLFFFIHGEGENSQIRRAAGLVVPNVPEGKDIRFDGQKLERFALEKITAINSFCAEHDTDPKPTIRRFCRELGLDIIEEMTEEQNAYPFEPEKITSAFLLEFFDTGYYFHTIDASDEPVLFILVDDPATAYYADAGLEIELFPSPHYPVISLEMTLYDIPESPMKMSFVYNVDIERHRSELYAYSEMKYITTTILFKENGVLHYGFTKAVDLSEELRKQIPGLIIASSNQLRAIPKEGRDFTRAVEDLFILKSEAAPEKKPEAGENYGADAAESAVEDAKIPRSPEKWQAGDKFSFVEKEEERVHQTELFGSDGKPSAGKKPYAGAEPEILEEIDLEMNDEPENGGSRVLRPSSGSDIPTSVLPESIQRITKALSKPIRRSVISVADELAITPAPKTVVLRNEDPLERLSRRLLIVEAKLETSKRENLRLKDELKETREETKRLGRENLSLENRKWRFWK